MDYADQYTTISTIIEQMQARLDSTIRPASVHARDHCDRTTDHDSDSTHDQWNCDLAYQRVQECAGLVIYYHEIELDHWHQLCEL